MPGYLLLFISCVFGVLFIRYLQSYDIHEKEPLFKMVLVTVFGGIVSFILAGLIYYGLDTLGINDLENGFGAIAVVGPVEEFSKLAGLMICLIFIWKEMNEPMDGLVYMSCVALGFSIIENYYYIYGSSNPIMTMGVRFLLSTPMHICFSLAMGIAVYSLAKFRFGWGLLLFSFTFAFVGHGLYDLIIFENLNALLMSLIIWISYVFAISLVAYCAALSPFRKTLKEFIESYENPESGPGLECVNCGNKEDKETYRLEGIVVQRCHSCGYYLSSKASLFRMFRHFGAQFRKLHKYYWPAENSKAAFSVLYDANYVSDEKKVAYFDLDELNNVLEKFTLDTIQSTPGMIRSVIKPSPSVLTKLEASVYGRREALRSFTFEVPEEGDTDVAVESENSAEITIEPDHPQPALEETVQQRVSHAPLKIEKPKLSARESFFRFLINPLAGSSDPRIVHTPQERGPLLSFGALIIPEFWFLWHDIWGAAFMVLITEIVTMYVAGRFLSFADSFLLAIILTRIGAALIGHRIYYYRHGKWLA